MRWSFLIALVACSTSTTLVDGGDGGGGREVRVDGCRPSAIADALRDAGPGDVVRFGGCELVGASFTVPPGVVLAGSGPEATTVEIDTPIEVEGVAEGCSGVRDLRIVSNADFAIRTVGPGEVCIDSVEIESTRGVGISAEGTTRLSVRDSTITGPVTADTADEEPVPGTPVSEDYAWRNGLVAICVEHVELENVEVRGWADMGVLVVDGRLTWRGGRIVETLATGLVVDRSEAELFDLEIADIYQGTRLIPAYGVVSSESVMTTSMLWLRGSEGYGALHNGGRAHHAGARVEESSNAGVWVQHGDLTVEDSNFDGNGVAAIVGVEADGVRIERTVLARSVLRTQIVGTMPVMIGDGLILDGQSGPVTLRDVTFEDNPRVGALVEFPVDFDATFEVEGVTVSPAVTEGVPGFVVVRGPPADGWIGGVTPMEAATQRMEPPLAFFGSAGLISAADLPAFNPSCE
jgi:hypothetical protein